MSIAALIRDMAAAGAPPEAIAIAVEAIEAANGLIESRRATERERKRKQRERDSHGTVTGQNRDSHGTNADTPSPPLPPNEINSNPPTPPHPDNTTRARKGRRLPFDWQPKPLGGEVGEMVKSWPAGAIERELARFRDWGKSATGKAATKLDWDAAWRNWLRREDDAKYGKHIRSGGNQGNRSTVRELGEQLARQFAAGN